jgi:hypothetical protein
MLAVLRTYTGTELWHFLAFVVLFDWWRDETGRGYLLRELSGTIMMFGRLFGLRKRKAVQATDWLGIKGSVFHGANHIHSLTFYLKTYSFV